MNSSFIQDDESIETTITDSLNGAVNYFKLFQLEICQKTKDKWPDFSRVKAELINSFSPDSEMLIGSKSALKDGF